MKLKKLLAAATAMLMLTSMVFTANADLDTMTGIDDQPSQSEELEEIIPPSEEKTDNSGSESEEGEKEEIPDADVSGEDENNGEEGEKEEIPDADIAGEGENKGEEKPSIIIPEDGDDIAIPASEGGIPINKANFPDDIFREQFVRRQDTDGDGTLSPEEIAEVTECNVSNMGISDLTGIKYFEKLTTLDCSYNELYFLDLSNMPNLVNFNCSYNYLFWLNLEGLRYNSPATEYGYQQTTLIKLPKRDVENLLRALEEDYGVDLSKIISWTGEITWNGPDPINGLVDITGTTVSYYYQTGIGPPMNKVLHLQEYSVPLNEENFSESFLKFIKSNRDLQSKIQQDNSILSADVTALTIKKEDGVDDLKGIEYFTNLKNFTCTGAGLETLDLTQNKKLTELYCGKNDLKTIDLTQNTELTRLICYENQLRETLDLTKNTKLDYLDCSNNQLIGLKVQGLTALKEIDCRNNNLQSVDLSGLTALLEFNSDNNEKLTSLNFNGCSALKVIDSSNIPSTTNTYSINRSSDIDYSRYKQTDLTSIDLTGCHGLQFLTLQNNSLQTIDLSDCEDLRELNLYNNKLTALDLSKQVKLGDAAGMYVHDTHKSAGLELRYNNLICLDISKTALVTNNKVPSGICSVNVSDVQSYNIAAPLENGDDLIAKLKAYDKTFDPAKAFNWQYISDNTNGYEALDYNGTGSLILSDPTTSGIRYTYKYYDGYNDNSISNDDERFIPTITFTLKTSENPGNGSQDDQTNKDPEKDDPEGDKEKDPEPDPDPNPTPENPDNKPEQFPPLNPPTYAQDHTGASKNKGEDISSGAGIFEDNELAFTAGNIKFTGIIPIAVLLAVILKKRLKTNK